MKQLLTAVVILFAGTAGAQSNDLHATSAASGEGVAGGVEISYTIGEMVLVDSKSANGLLITQGILQPEAGIAAGNNTGTFEPGELQVFPVPTRDNLGVSISVLQKGNVTLTLFDAQGQRLINDAFSYNSFITKNYSLAKYAAGTYFLRVILDNGNAEKRKGIYTIVKTN